MGSTLFVPPTGFDLQTQNYNSVTFSFPGCDPMIETMSDTTVDMAVSTIAAGDENYLNTDVYKKAQD